MDSRANSRNSICATLRQHGYQALLAGGCVRDLLLERAPVDYDVATDATARAGDGAVSESAGGWRAIWRRAGLGDGLKVEVATFRSDVGLFRRAAARSRWSTRSRRKKMCSGATSRSTDC